MALPGDEDKQTSPTSPEHVVWLEQRGRTPVCCIESEQSLTEDAEVVGAEDGVELSELNKVVEGCAVLCVNDCSRVISRIRS